MGTGRRGAHRPDEDRGREDAPGLPAGRAPKVTPRVGLPRLDSCDANEEVKVLWSMGWDGAGLSGVVEVRG